MDYDAVINLVKAAGFGSDTQTNGAISIAINAGLLELASERQWSWLLARDTTGVLTVGSEVVPQPTGLLAPRSLRLSRGTATSSPHYTPLSRIDEEEVRNWNFQDQGTDLPDVWAWIDRTIVVYPKPDYAYNVDLSYVKEPVPSNFASGAQTPPFEIRFHPILAWGAIRWLALRQRNFELHGAATAEWERAKRNFKQADEVNQQSHVAQWPGWTVLDADFRF